MVRNERQNYQFYYYIHIHIQLILLKQGGRVERSLLNSEVKTLSNVFSIFNLSSQTCSTSGLILLKNSFSCTGKCNSLVFFPTQMLPCGFQRMTFKPIFTKCLIGHERVHIHFDFQREYIP